MLNIKKDGTDSALTMTLEGRLDTTTAPQLEEELAANLDGVTDLVFEISSLEYISSAGLRVLLSAQKIMNKQGGMVVRGATDEVMEIFEVTGFSDILTIE
ncbi:MAG: STAS domain-containing protein [Lachnospiraceae bacterium]|nr:STAS domain-containing protein [Lachnospiraceae bacterium]